MNTRLRKLRKQKNFFQEDVAKKVGVTADYISMLERGVKSPGRALIVKLAALYECSVDYILFGKPANNQFENKNDRSSREKTA